MASESGRPSWTFLTNHGHVLLAVAADPDARIEELAARVGVSARAVLGILPDLADDGYVIRSRRGRRTHYEVVSHRPFRHPHEADREIGRLLAIFAR